MPAASRVRSSSDMLGDGLTPTPAELKKHVNAVYGVVKQYHEPLVPVGSSEHSITGNLTQSSLAKVMSTLCGLPAPYNLTTNSLFLDIGSGQNRPCFCLGGLNIRGTIGIEVQSLITRMSCLVLKRLWNNQTLQSPCLVTQGDIFRIKDVESITHAYMFLWSHPKILRHVCTLLAESSTLKVVTMVSRGTPSELVEEGLLTSEELHSPSLVECEITSVVGEKNAGPPQSPVRKRKRNARAMASPGATSPLPDVQEVRRISVHMPGGKTYSLYVILLTPERKERMRQVAARNIWEQKKDEKKDDTNQSDMTSLLDMKMGPTPSDTTTAEAPSLRHMLESHENYDKYIGSIQLGELFNSNTRELRSRKVSI